MSTIEETTVSDDPGMDAAVAAAVRAMLGNPVQDHPVGLGVECPACGSATIPTWPFEHCWKCGNRTWDGPVTDDSVEGLRKRIAELEAREQERLATVNEAAADAEVSPEELRYRELWGKQRFGDISSDESMELAEMERSRRTYTNPGEV